VIEVAGSIDYAGLVSVYLRMRKNILKKQGRFVRMMEN